MKAHVHSTLNVSRYKCIHWNGENLWPHFCTKSSEEFRVLVISILFVHGQHVDKELAAVERGKSFLSDVPFDLHHCHKIPRPMFPIEQIEDMDILEVAQARHPFLPRGDNEFVRFQLLRIFK